MIEIVTGIHYDAEDAFRELMAVLPHRVASPRDLEISEDQAVIVVRRSDKGFYATATYDPTKVDAV